MRNRASLALAACVVLALGRGWGADPEGSEKERPPAKNSGGSADPLVVRPTYTLTPEPPRPEFAGVLVVQEPPPPAPPPVPGVEPPMLITFTPEFSQVLSSQRVTLSVPSTRAPGVGVLTTANLNAVVHAPVAPGSAFQVADNEGARPVDRVFLTFGYFLGPVLPAEPVGPAPAALSGANILTKPFNRSDASGLRTNASSLYREVFGFEKVVLDGNASVGLRTPVFQIQNTGPLELAGVGDLTLLFKYALFNDRQSGNLVSAGLALTAPTGPDLVPVPGASAIHPVLFQPFAGGVWHYERLYAQGFSSLVVPTDARDAVLWFNNLALGYQLYGDPLSGVLTGVIPSVQMNFCTPFTHRGLNAPFVGALDTAALAGGLHLTFHRLCLTVGASTPLTGPHPTDLGGFAQVNFVF